MNSDKQFLDTDNENIEAITVQPDVDDAATETGKGTVAAGVAGAAVGAVVGGKIGGRTGAVVGAVVGAVAGSMTAQATPDDVTDKVKEAAGNAANKLQDAVESAKPAIESMTDKVKSGAVSAADNVENAAEQAKPSENPGDRNMEVKINERVVWNPTLYVADEQTVTESGESFPEITRLEVEGETSDIDKQNVVRESTRPVY